MAGGGGALALLASAYCTPALPRSVIPGGVGLGGSALPKQTVGDPREEALHGWRCYSRLAGSGSLDEWVSSSPLLLQPC